MSESRQDVMRWYTRALRIPKLVGKMPGPGGGHWPGGPYTVTQVVGGAAVAVAGSQTIGWWGRWGFFGNYAVLAAAVAAAGFALGRVRTGGRDPLSAVLAVAGLYTQPRAGRWRGRPIRLPRPGRPCGRVLALLPVDPAAAAPTPADPIPVGQHAPSSERRTPSPAHAAQLHAARAMDSAGAAATGRPDVRLTGVDLLLAQVSSSGDRRRAT